MYSMVIRLILKIYLFNNPSFAELLNALTCFSKKYSMESGWDPDVKKFLIKVLNSLSLVLLWMIACATAGIYFQLGHINGGPLIYTILFYSVMMITLFLLLRYLFKIWKSQ